MTYPSGRASRLSRAIRLGWTAVTRTDPATAAPKPEPHRARTDDGQAHQEQRPARADRSVRDVQDRLWHDRGQRHHSDHEQADRPGPHVSDQPASGDKHQEQIADHDCTRRSAADHQDLGRHEGRCAGSHLTDRPLDEQS